MISDEIRSKFQSLKEIIQSESLINEEKAESLINDLKLEFLQFQLLTPKEFELSQENIIMFRDILEYDALFSIRTKNLEEFERAMAQLKCYYFRETDLPPSEDMPLLIAIHLVAILGRKDPNKSQVVNKKFVDFNIELQLARDFIGDNEYLNYAADLHQSVIENSFARLFLLENQPPSPLFDQFTADILSGARDSHADSIERAYEFLTLSEISSILHFNNDEEARQFVDKRGWDIKEDGITVKFNREEGQSKTSEDMLKRAISLSDKISTLA